MVERYDLEFYLIGATQPFQVTNLGKPVPEADGKIREDFTTRLSSWPLPVVLYETRVAAVGSTGIGRSDVSNQFSFSDTMAPTVTLTAPPSGATVSGTVWLTATATDDVGVVGVQFLLDGAPLDAEDTVAPYAAPWDTTTASNGSSHTLEARARDAAANTATSAPPVSVTVDNSVPPAPTGLVAAWAFDEGSGTVATDATGNGNDGTVVGASWTPQGRYGEALSFDGTNDYVGLADNAALNATTSFTFTAWVRRAATGSWQVLFQHGATSGNWGVYFSDGNQMDFSEWGVSDLRAGSALTDTANWHHVAWVKAGDSGTNVTFYVDGTVVGAVATGGATAGGAKRIGGDAWYEADYFNGLIDNVRLYDRALNPGELQADMTTAVSNTSAPCAYTLAPTSASVAGTGGSGTVTLTTGAGCTWTASSSASWITVSPTSGTGSGNASYTVAANTSTSTRTGTMAIGGQTFTVTQAGVCNYTLAATSASMAGTGGSGTVTLTTGAGCTWTASSSASWITVSPTSGTGAGGVGYTVAANTSTSTRTGTMAIGGQTFTVTQAGVCNYTLAPTSASMAGTGGSGTVTLTTGAGCTWTASSSASWITVSPTSGTGADTVDYTVAANTPAGPRTGTIAIAGQTFTVTQEQRAPGPPEAPTNVRVGRP